MGDKDSPLDGLFNGKQQIIVFLHNAPEDTAFLGEVISDSLEFTPSQDEDDIEVNKGVVNGRISFTLNNMTNLDDDTLTQVSGIGVASTNLIASVSIEGKPYIYRPDNLKYPNKKRAKRIWKKWKKRFGVRAEKYLYIPKAEITKDVEFGEDGSMTISTHITAKE